MLTNLAQEIEDRLASLTVEPIEQVLLAQIHGEHDSAVPVGRVLTWSEARPWLAAPFNASNPTKARGFYVYTKSWVLFLVGNLDRGGVTVEAVPRGPSANRPVEIHLW